jgi:hypothetical protein
VIFCHWDIGYAGARRRRLNIGEREAPCLADEARSPPGQRIILPVWVASHQSLSPKQKWDYVVPFLVESTLCGRVRIWRTGV